MSQGRRKARELALQALYALEISGEPPLECLEAILAHDPADAEQAEYARRLVQGTVAALPSIDPLLERWSQSWSLPRMAAVDRNLLRLGAYELLHHEDVPRKVVLNEAVEIAKRYGDDKSASFVNAILDKIRRASEEPEPPA